MPVRAVNTYWFCYQRFVSLKFSDLRCIHAKPSTSGIPKDLLQTFPFITTILRYFYRRVDFSHICKRIDRCRFTDSYPIHFKPLSSKRFTIRDIMFVVHRLFEFFLVSPYPFT